MERLSSRERDKIFIAKPERKPIASDIEAKPTRSRGGREEMRESHTGLGRTSALSQPQAKEDTASNREKRRSGLRNQPTFFIALKERQKPTLLM